jgi:glycosidase
VVVAGLLFLGPGGCGGGDGAPAGPVSPNTSGWWRDQVVYQVFVRSFADSDGDGVGDLAGLTARLDALNDGDPATSSDLGVDALWLMPIHPSPSYHGYDVSDYRQVNSQYGTEADFDAFLAAAHARGIEVILDMVLNHSSDQHLWFVNSQSGADAVKRGWYVWSATDPGWGSPLGGAPPWRPAATGWYYAAFSDTMPDLDLEAPAVEAELVDVMRGWLARGVDGFRLDAVRYLVANGPSQQVDQPESHAFLKRVRAALHAQHPRALLVAEAWANTETVASYYGAGDEVQLAFAFDQADAIRASLLGGASSHLVNVLARAEAALAGKDRGFEAPFLSNHDQPREARALAGDLPSLRLAAATLFALPGTPFVYYGEELGMQGGAAADDRNKRTPYRWDATGPGYGFTTGTPWFTAPEAAGVDLASAQADPGSLWHLYRSLIALRHARPALATGEAARPAVAGGGDGALALLRTAGGARVLFVANFAAAASGPFTVTAPGAPVVLAAEGLTGAPMAGGGLVTVPGLGARGWAFLALE